MGLPPQQQLQTPNSFSNHFMNNNNNNIGTPNAGNVGFNPNPQNSFFSNQMANPPSFGNMNMGINSINNNINSNINNNSNPMNTMNFSQSSSSPSQQINLLNSFPSNPQRP